MIREAQSKDLEAILSLWLNGNLQSHIFISADFYRDRQDLMKMLLPSSTLYVQDLNGEIKGFIGLSDNLVSGIFIDENYQKQGLGVSLLNQVKGLHSDLFVYVYPQNKNALNFFQSQGFEIIEETINEETGISEYLLHCQNVRHVNIGCCAL